MAAAQKRPSKEFYCRQLKDPNAENRVKALQGLGLGFF